MLDQFAGGGTTLVEARLLNRDTIRIDINEIAIEYCHKKTTFNCKFATGKVYINKGDAHDLKAIPNESIDLICTHPPYANIIKYSNDIDGDLSRLNVKDFLEQMNVVAAECFRVLKKGKFCAILMGDIRQNGYMLLMNFDVMRVFQNAGFRSKSCCKKQHSCIATKCWQKSNMKNHFLLKCVCKP